LIQTILCALALVFAQGASSQCIPTSATGFQENLLQATFHTVLYKTPNGYAASGRATAANGADQPNIQEISNANGYAGIPASTDLVWGTVGGHAQLIFLGDDNIIYAGGVEGVVLNPTLTPSFAYGPTSLAMPAGLSYSDVIKFQAANEVIMMVTSAGKIYLSGNVCANVASPCTNTVWNLLSLPTGVTPVMVDLNFRTIFMYGSDGNFYTRGARNFLGDGSPMFASGLNWAQMQSPPLSAGSSPVQIEIGSYVNQAQLSYLVLDANGTIHSIGNAPIVGNNSNSSLTWTKIGQGCSNGILQDVVFISASDNDNRNLGAGAILSDGTIRLWGMNDNDMLAGAPTTCPEVPCTSAGSEMNAVVYLENGTHLTPSIGAAGTICNVGHNSDGGFGDGTEDDRVCYECVELPALPVLCVNGDCGSDSTVVATICEGQLYMEGGSSYSSTGTYIDVYQTTEGCDSTVTTELTVIAAFSVSNTITICSGASYSEGSSVYTETGIYTDSYSTVSGCDSTITTDITVEPSWGITNEVSICEGETYYEQSSAYTETGTYTDSYPSASGCDSIVTTTLTVHDFLETTKQVSICEGETHYEQSSAYTISGTYTDTYPSALGCDSMVTTILTVHPNYALSNAISICEGQTYYEQSSAYTESGTYLDSYSSASGCDSVITTILTVVPYYETSNLISICAGETYYEQSSAYTASGTYSDVYFSAGGCDSVVTTILTLNPLEETSNTVLICQGENYFEQSSVYAVSGSYTDVYQSSFGCDSTVYTLLTVIPLPEVLLSSVVIESCESMEVTFQNLASNSEPLTYQWTTSNGLISSQAQASFLFEGTGTYFVDLSVSTSNGCASSSNSSQMVILHSGPTAEFTADSWEADLSSPQINFTENSSDDVISYSWTFGDGASGTGASISHTYVEIGTFQVTLHVVSEWGCEDEVRHPVLIRPDYNVLIPNAFTPNLNGPSDGSYDVTDTQNQIFFPYADYVDEFEMYIFNRWGEQLFVSTDVNIGWDGYFKGRLCAQDVYSYRVKLKYLDGFKVEQLGTVTLFR